MIARLGSILLLGSAMACGSLREPSEPSVRPADAPMAARTFSRLQSMEGNWRGTVGGDSSLPVRVTYESAGGGSAIVERLFIPGDSRDALMISVYYRDGDRLLLDHYCAAANQPRMLLEAGSTTDEAVFAFTSATGLRSDGALHVHDGRIRFQGEDAVVATWRNFEAGQHLHDNALHLTRMP